MELYIDAIKYHKMLLSERIRNVKTVNGMKAFQSWVIQLSKLYPEVDWVNSRNIRNIVSKSCKYLGINADLNWIPLKHVKQMKYVFMDSEFNGDISKWDVSHVVSMEGMFYKSCFNGDISGWDVSNVTNMMWMFYGSRFNGDISRWNVSHVKNMDSMFAWSKFNQDISQWDTSSVEKADYMFYKSNFNHDVSNWMFLHGTPDLKIGKEK